MKKATIETMIQPFQETFGTPPAVAAFAPGRVEVLGNHTDYNEGFVLSCAIEEGVTFLASAIPGKTCRLIAGDFGEQVTFACDNPQPQPEHPWAAYAIGVYARLLPHLSRPFAWQAIFHGTVPRGAGLSSSAAISMATAKALCRLGAIEPDPLTIARIGQQAEHEFAGVRCGLLDQLSSLCGQQHHLLQTDFRSFEMQSVPLEPQTCFILASSGTTHTLGDGVYNERRADCEEAAKAFDALLPHSVPMLRDVSMQEWIDNQAQLPPRAAKRAAHVIGENTRVLEAADALRRGDLAHFGFLMFESHHSSMVNFENSCPELDTIISIARQTPGILGGRLSGGGFGGSAILLAHADAVEDIVRTLPQAFAAKHQTPCELHVIHPAEGARLIPLLPSVPNPATAKRL